MSTKKQIDANRRNGALSNGPTTPEGKALAAKNSFKHGLFSREALLPEEDQNLFNKLAERVQARFAPEDDIERALVAKIIGIFWRLERIGKLEAGILAWHRCEMAAKRSIALSEPGGPEDVACEARQLKVEDLASFAEAYIHGEDSLAKLSRYETSLLRNLLRVIQELERLQKQRKRNARRPHS